MASAGYPYAADNQKDVNEITRKLADWNELIINFFDERHAESIKKFM